MRDPDPVERAWRDLRRHLKRAPDAPFVVYAFAEDPEPVGRLLERLGLTLRARGVSFRRLTPKSPEALVGVLGSIFDEAGAVAVVDAVHEDAEQSTAWSDAWATVAARLNAGRAQVKTELRGLVLAMPMSAWNRVRAASPDLWSIRDVLCELGAARPGASGASTELGRTQRMPAPSAVGLAASAFAAPALAAVDAIEAREGHSEGWARSLADALPGILAREGPSEAVRLGHQALAVLPRTDATWPALLAAVADAESAHGDESSAIAHWREAAEAADPLDRRSLAWLREASERLTALLFVDAATGVAAEMHSRALRRLAVSLDGVALRDLAMSLESLGAVAAARGSWGEAAAHYGELLTACRRLVAERGDTQEALRDLSVALDDVATAYMWLGRWLEAASLLRESLTLRRRLAVELGDTPEALRDLAVSLDNVGRVAEAQGQPDAAGSLYAESLGVCRRVLAAGGETPQALRDLSISLEHVGRLAVSRERWEEAAALFGESLAIRRRLVTELGATPQALRDLSISLDNLGNLAAVGDRWEEAGPSFGESLAIRRRLVVELGDFPEALRDLSIALARAGRVALAQRRLAQAGSLYGESLVVRGQLATGKNKAASPLTALGQTLLHLAALAGRESGGELAQELRAANDALAALPADVLDPTVREALRATLDGFAGGPAGAPH